MSKTQNLFGGVIFVVVGFNGLLGFAQQSVVSSHEIRAIFSDKCYECHGPDEGSRQGDLRLDRESDVFGNRETPIVVRGEPADSELFRRVSTSDAALRMPPEDSGKALSQVEIEKIQQWITAGANWQQHWAYVAPRRPSVPAVSDAQGVHNEIDHFILQRLKQEGLEPSVPADRVTLARRLHFDLLGLPPSMQDIASFTNENQQVAYETLVDRLLESPHFGERMAIYWLDVVRYADSNGYHSDEAREIAPYRDYVIQAFHTNKPFDQFVIEQLAGDLLPAASIEQRVASGFNMLLQTTTEGGAQDKEYLAKYVADRVRNTASIFLGVTLGCAECHDHKFDPFTTREFYSMGAFFADIKEKGRGVLPTYQVWEPGQEEQLKKFDQRIDSLQPLLNRLTPELRSSRQNWEVARASVAEKTTTPPTAVMEPWYLFGPIPMPAGNRDLVKAFEFVFPPERAIDLAQEYPSGRWKKSEELVDGKVHKLSKGSGTSYLYRRVHANKTMVAELALGGQDHLAVWLNGAQVFEDRSKNPVKVDEHLITIRLHEGENTLLMKIAAKKDRAGFYFRLTPGTIPAAISETLAMPSEQRSDEARQKLDEFYRGFAPELLDVRRELAEVQRQKYQLIHSVVKKTLMTVATEPRSIRVLPRGNWMDDSGPEVQPGIPGSLNVLNVTDRRATRLDLARWMIDADNPLTTRVFVNRLWKLFFGRGLATPLDDLGAQGAPPTHPELLDWLAVEFRESGWNVKHIVKQMVMSATYRQTSVPTPALQQRDPYNQLYARQARFRLDAEMVRDNALAISGLLVRDIGGRSVKPYQPQGYWRHMNFPVREWQRDAGSQLYRRGLYTWWQRMFLHPAMVAFDAPSREECTVERPRSNTPLQALVLLNDPTYVEAARVFAEQVMRKGGQSFPERLNWAFHQALSRDAKPTELELLKSVYQRHWASFGEDLAAVQKLVSTGDYVVAAGLDPVELAAWTSVTRVLLNLHETISRM